MTEKGKEILECVDELRSVEYENETENENVVDITKIPGDNMVVGDGAIVPAVGMKFKDDNEVFEFYKRYAYDTCFPVRKRNSRKDDDGVLKSITIVCSREGKRITNTSDSFKPQATIQSGCKTRITAFTLTCGIWRINTVHVDQNHKTSPSKSKLYRCNLTTDDEVKYDAIIEWINNQCLQLSTLKSSSNSNLLSPHMTLISSDCGATKDIGMCSIRDSECAKRKGALKKLRRKSALEVSSNKVKATSSSGKGKKSNVRTSRVENATPVIQSAQHFHMQLPFSYTHLLMGGNQGQQIS